VAGILIKGAALQDPDRSISPAINTWTRLEPLPLTADFEPALQAAIADPLWLLCRQWQFLEFAGEDAGTPIEVRVEGESSLLSRYLPGGVKTLARGYSSDVLPLEAVVEREPIRERHPRLAAEAGVHLQWMLNDGRLNNAFVAAYPLEVPVDTDAEADRAGADWQELARGRALDARKLHAVLVPLRDATGRLTALPPAPAVPADQQAKALVVLQRWLSWYEDFGVEGDAEAWSTSRLEYAFGVSANAAPQELALGADEYTDGTLDWYAVAARASLGRPQPGTPAPQPPTQLRLRPSLPSPVEYPGKPADRFWEFEDAAVHFGAIDAGPTDLARMLVVEFALVYGNDWFVVPVRLPVGSLLRVTSFTVRDTFGVTTAITRSRNTGETPWSLFEISGDPPSVGRDHFFLSPTLAQRLEGEPIERVALARDEMANMAWAVEELVQGSSGDPYDRAEEAAIEAARQHVDGPPVDARLVYHLATSVPGHWHPLVPVPAPKSDPANPTIQLERRTFQRTEPNGQQRRIHPKGLLLRTDARQAPDTEPRLRIEEEEVPREGAVVQRTFQYARWFDGRSLLWLGRRKQAGRGEASSGLRFDQLSRP
jgi:hypothetical protein